MRRQPRLVVLALCAAVACVAVAGSASLSAFGSMPVRPTPRQDKLFRAITAGNVSDVRKRINGSANAYNQIPTGTVLTYTTSTGNLGKMQILRYGYNLRIRWATYRPNGMVLSSGTNLLIRGTYTYDLDRGVASAGPDDSSTDFWWEQATDKLRYLTALNGASFTIASYKRCELLAGGPGTSPCQTNS